MPETILETPKHPIILAHGLLGFSELRLFGSHLPGIQYWRGIQDALMMNDIEVITTTVPPLESIETRAAILASQIADKANGKKVNIIAYVYILTMKNLLLTNHIGIAW